MTLAELQSKLDEDGVLRGLYSLAGGVPDNQTYTINEQNGKFHVYYTERGGRYDLAVFDNQEDAVDHFMKNFYTELVKYSNDAKRARGLFNLKSGIPSRAPRDRSAGAGRPGRNSHAGREPSVNV